MCMFLYLQTKRSMYKKLSDYEESYWDNTLQVSFTGDSAMINLSSI